MAKRHKGLVIKGGHMGGKKHHKGGKKRHHKGGRRKR